MAFAENLDRFFETLDFAVQAVVTLSGGGQKTLSVIFDTITEGAELLDTNLEADTPQFQCKTSDLVGVQRKNSVVLGGTSYKIGRIRDDGSGVSTVYLKS